MPIEFQLVEKNGGITNRAIVSWRAGEGGHTKSFVVGYRVGKGTYKDSSTTQNLLQIDGLVESTTLEVRVKAVGLGFPPKESRYAYASAIVPSLPTSLSGDQILANVANVSIGPINDTQAVLRWLSPRNERLNNLVAVIKHSSATDGSGSFTDSVRLANVPASANTATVPLINGEYIIKLQDQVTKKFSATEVGVILNIPDALPKLLIETRREDQDNPPFGGVKSDVVYSSDSDGLILDTTEAVDGVYSGEYIFAATKTLPAKFQVNLERTLVSRGLFPSDLIDSRTALVDSWADWDGAIAEETSAALYVRSSEQVPEDDNFQLESNPDLFLLEDGDNLLQESSVFFGSWAVLDRTTLVGRTFQFKAELESFQPDETPLVDQLGYRMSMPSRTENSSTITSTVGSDTYSFANAFYEAPSVGITAFNIQDGDYYELTSVTRTGFTVHFKNSTNSVSRQFRYVAAGFGSEQA